MQSRDIKDLERKTDFLSALNKILANDGIPTISQKAIGNFVMDRNRKSTQEKAQKFNEQKTAKLKAQTEAKKGMQSRDPGLRPFARLTYQYMDTSGTPEANERNKQMYQKFADPNECAKEVNKHYKDAMNMNFDEIFNPNVSISKLVDLYENNREVYDNAFVAYNFGGDAFGKYVYDPRTAPIAEKKGILESLNDAQCAIDLAANSLYNILPLEGMNDKQILGIAAHCSELMEEFPELCEEFNITQENVMSTLSNVAAISNTRAMAEMMQGGPQKDINDFLKHCHFEKDGKKVSYNDVSRFISDGGSPEGFKIAYDDPKTIAETDQALKGDDMVFGTYDEIMSKEGAKESIQTSIKVGKYLVEEVNGELGLFHEKAIPDSSVENVARDENRQRQHEEALKIKSLEVDQNNILTSIQQELGIKANNGAESRLIATYIDTSGTKEAREKNEALIRKASTKEGMLEISNEALKEIINLDPKDIYAKDNSMDSLLAHSRENNARNRRCFAVKSIIADNGVDYRLQDILDKNISFLENNTSERAVMLAASELYTIVPDVILDDPEKVDALMSRMPKIQENLGKYSSAFEMNNLTETLSNIRLLAQVKENDFARDMVMQDKANIFEGEYVVEGKETTHFGDLGEAKKNGEKVTFVKYSDTRKADIQEALKGNILTTKEEAKGKIDKLFALIEGQDGIDSFSQEFTKTHSIFSKDTQQFKDMEASLVNVVKICKDYKDPKNKSIEGKANLARNLKEALNDLQDKTKTYRDKKQTEKESGKRFSSRSQQRLDLASNLLNMVDKTLAFDKVKVTDTPFRKPLPMDRVQKLESDIKPKEVSIDKQKVINEPVKEVNLEQGIK